MLPSLRPVGAAQDLGLGGQLTQQVQTETEEVRRRRMQEAQQARLTGAPPALSIMTLGMGGYGAG